MRKESDKFPLRMVALISQLGITMMVSLFMCIGIGYFLSEKTGNVLLFLVFIFLGILAGFRSCYTIIQRFEKIDFNTGKKDKKEIVDDDSDTMDEKCQ